MSKRLEKYNFPRDLKTMSVNELELLAVEIRDFLISNISKTGGHLASNLGVVELSIVLHKLLDTPKDKIVWDVGHQSYVHKILTERVKDFSTLRQFNGISGFPKRAESQYDCYDTGHSSTSVSVVAGMAKARDIRNEDFETVAVIGDGALTGGLAYEGLNNLGVSGSKAIVILNDNNMSIGDSTGGLSNHLSKLRASKGYYNFKKNITKTMKKIPCVGKGIHGGMEKIRDSLKYALVDGVMFEELGFKYFGPIDGHNIESLIEHINLAKSLDGPVVLHIITKKGKGYRNAENNPHTFHGTGPFDTTTGNNLTCQKDPTYSQIFGNSLIELAKKDERIVAISAAMIEGTGLKEFAEIFPHRTFDVGIAEAHGVTFSGGLATGGLRPIVAIYSTFLQRAYDQIMVDVSLQNLPVVFAIDRAGNVGADGETHHGVFDISFLMPMPNMKIMAPKDGHELKDMLAFAVENNGPSAIRYPRGVVKNLTFNSNAFEEIRNCKAEVIDTGKDVEIWAAGNMLSTAIEVKNTLKNKGFSVGVTNPRFLKPIDLETLFESSKRTNHIITLEDNVITGGFGEQIKSILANSDVNVINFGWPDKFIEHGSVEALYKKYGLDVKSLVERISEIIER